MKIKIEINCDDAALHDNLEVELPRILTTALGKVYAQLERDGRCICEALESDDKLLDINGNTVGTVRVIRD
jgi:hypothetical protein